MRPSVASDRAGLETVVPFGQSAPVALRPLRALLKALEAEAPEAVRSVARRHPPAWNRLFPGTFGKAPPLDEVALSPSERRLHRESEQMFQVLNLAAAAICEGVRHTGRTLVLEEVGAADLISLRAVMRAQEWARLTGDPLPLRLEGWGTRSAHQSERYLPRRQRFHAALRERLRINGPQEATVRGMVAPDPHWGSDAEPEARFLGLALDPHQSEAVRIAAAIRAVRACFFTTNYEGAMLAVEQAQSLLERHPSLKVNQVLDAWQGLGEETTTAAIEIERADVESMDDLRALFFRGEGVVRSFGGENELALECFGRGLALEVGPLQRGHLHMFRALTRIKRIGQLKEAREEGVAGLESVTPVQGDHARLHEAWLRNVVALTWFQEKNLEAAVGEEVQAIRCLAEQYTPSATHLRINLITNLSSIQEAAKQFDQAIATWRKFEKTISAWDDNFYKHHRYRLGALQRGAGRMDEALACYQEAYRSAAKLQDAFHQQVIASDLGHLSLAAGDTAGSRSWFEQATAHARSLGDPFHVGEGLAGQWLCGAATAPEAQRALEADSTWPQESARLLAALAEGNREAVQKAMTPPRTKLNRPFDLVNLY